MKRQGPRFENIRETLLALLGGVASTLTIAWLPRLGVKPVVAASATAALAGAGAVFTRGPLQAALAGAAAAGAASLVQLWFARRAALRGGTAAASPGTMPAASPPRQATGSVLDRALEAAVWNLRRSNAAGPDRQDNGSEGGAQAGGAAALRSAPAMPPAAPEAQTLSIQGTIAVAEPDPSADSAMTAIVAQLAPEEQETLAQLFAVLPPESAGLIRSRLARLRVETAVDFLRDLLRRHSRPAAAEAA